MFLKDRREQGSEVRNLTIFSPHATLDLSGVESARPFAAQGVRDKPIVTSLAIISEEVSLLSGGRVGIHRNLAYFSSFNNETIAERIKNIHL